MAGLVLKCMGTMGVLLFKVWWVGISDTIELEDFLKKAYNPHVRGPEPTGLCGLCA